MSHVDSLAQTEMLAFWASQLSSIHLYLSMYTEPEEIEIAAGVRENIEYMQRIVETGELDRLVPLPKWIAFTLHIQIVNLQTIDLIVSIPLISNEQEQTTADPVLSLRHPVWLDRKRYSLLAQGLPRGPDSVFAGIEYLREAAPNLVSSKQNPPTAGSEESREIVRVWFYFPSLSTREKRRDIVDWAPEYHLTGCVMAGKPGILCLEGTANDIDLYMSDIKVKSWSDIPSFQKKVTERWREEGKDIKRAFQDMSEITGLIDKHGARGNRADMSQVERLLEEKGLAEAFSRVFLQSM